MTARPLLPVLFLLVSAHAALAQGYLCAEGGGGITKGDWAAEVFDWMIERARECDEATPGGGDGIQVVILDIETGNDTVEQFFLDRGADRVTQLAVLADNAASDSVVSAIRAAEIIWIPGGAQSRYVANWSGTPVIDAVRSVYDRGGVVGGTSAGCAVLGDLVYDALRGSLQPRDTLQSSAPERLTLTRPFFDLTSRLAARASAAGSDDPPAPPPAEPPPAAALPRAVLFDTHFTQRGRLPRTALMVARARRDLAIDTLAIGVDDRTAVCIDPDGSARIRGEGAATFLFLTPGSRIDLPDAAPPRITGVSITVLPHGWVYDVPGRVPRGRFDTDTEPQLFPPGAVRDLPPHPVRDADLIIDGADPRPPTRTILWPEGDTGAYRASSLMVFGPASDDPAVITRAYADSGFTENRMAGLLLLAVAGDSPRVLAALIDEDCGLVIPPDDSLAVRGGSSALILDARTSRAAILPPSPDPDHPFRHRVAIIDARLHILPPGDTWPPADDAPAP